MNTTDGFTSIEIAAIKEQIGAEHGFDVKSLFAYLELQPGRSQNPPSDLKPKPIPQHVAEPAA
jgi:hypothetical protein